MKSFYLIFLLTVVTSSTKLNWSDVFPLHILPSIVEKFPNSNENKIQNGRIVGGFEVEPNSLPYQVGLALPIPILNRTAWCGGSLISNQHIITAAHCVELANGTIVFLGAHNIKNNETTQIRIQVPKSNLIIHEKWNRFRLQNDIAIVKLPSPIEFNENIQPINLPTRKQQNDKFVGKFVIASGWGKDADESKGVSPVLRAVQNPVISRFRCTIRYFGIIRDSHICMSGRSGKSTCSGDSGGPLVIENEDKSNTLVGTTSFGIAFGCERNWPAVFTRITYYLDWISEKTGIEIKP